MVITGGLLLLEPDFGAFVVIVAIAFGILFLGGPRLAPVPRASRSCCRSRCRPS
jgi:cell division protein FtsW (lipid II flippase)